MQEFLGWTLDDLHEELNKAEKKPYRKVCGHCEPRALCRWLWFPMVHMHFPHKLASVVDMSVERKR